MRIVIPTTRYKKDLKKYAKQPSKMEALLKIIRKLENEEPIPKENKPHILKGDYKGYWECHIEDDFLLIWIEDDIVELIRLGSHSELFGKKRR